MHNLLETEISITELLELRRKAAAFEVLVAREWYVERHWTGYLAGWHEGIRERGDTAVEAVENAHKSWLALQEKEEE